MRFFMTINEAVQLVIQARVYLEGEETFVLDMGEPVPILELADKMIALLSEGRNIDIEFTGSRPGEKLHERLRYQYEELLDTPYPKIRNARDRRHLAANRSGL